ncbi:MAG TPA: GTP cyclohydrolase I FolE2, partial [Oxalobacteraceae bacterium]|nr:GTP cyclohydrolase I FolE2 [Oxalobacteraceae bacterium]
MNIHDLNLSSIPDVQSTPDTRRIAIQRVGVKGVRFPIAVKTGSGVQASVGTWNMYVHLSDAQKGTHMSRFIGLLEGNREPLDFAGFEALMRKMVLLLEA